MVLCVHQKLVEGNALDQIKKRVTCKTLRLLITIISITVSKSLRAMIQKRIMKKDFKEDCEEGKVVIQAIEKDLIDADVTVDIAEGVVGVVGVVVVVVVVIGEVAV